MEFTEKSRGQRRARIVPDPEVEKTSNVEVQYQEKKNPGPASLNGRVDEELEQEQVGDEDKDDVEGAKNSGASSESDSSDNWITEDEYSDEEEDKDLVKVLSGCAGLPKYLKLRKEELPFAELITGDRCWKCVNTMVFYTCEGCGRHYHRKCVILGPGYAFPIFDKPLEQACLLDKGEAKLLKCSECIVSEKTSVQPLKEIPFETLSTALIQVAKAVFSQYGDDEYRAINDKKAMHLSKIVSKAEAGSYKTVEGLHQDYKQILFDTKLRHGEKSEQYEVAENFMRVAKEELKIMIACIDCYIRSKVKERQRSKAHWGEVCRVPHLLVWVKLPRYPFWPSKALIVDPQRKVLMIQCFDETAVRSIPLSENSSIRIYSEKHPGKKPPSGNSVYKAVAECKQYVINAGQRFGKVVIDDMNSPFDGTLGDFLAKQKLMFPEHFAD